ncbi:MAG TPA: hypothetical protein V6D14_32885 [Coleofasciculaceae cyanobacterium]|jgi:hypothetical protein
MLSLRYLTTSVLSASLFVLPTFVPSSVVSRLPSFLAQAQPTPPEAAIDRLFKADSAPPGSSSKQQRLFADVKTWMGAYQGVQKDGSIYLATFERGSLPVSVRLDDKGQITSMSVGCPNSTSLNLNQASVEIRQMLSRCPGLEN